MRVAERIQKQIIEFLNKEGVSAVPEDIVIEHPADISHGDYATGVALKLAKRAEMTPRALAERVVSGMGNVPGIAKADIAGPGFINFHLSNEAIAEALEESRKDKRWGANAREKEKKIMVEYTDPNPFKEFHIGHLMSNAIGEAFARLFEFSGAKVVRANYQGDVGLHVAKSIYAHIFHKPNIGNAIVRWGLSYKIGNDLYESNEESKRLINEINQRIYSNDSELMPLYEEGRKTSLDHFEEIYKILGTKFDRYFFESEATPFGMTIVQEYPDVFVESDGARVFRGEDEGLHTRVFLTSQGLPTYEAKDLGLLKLKSKEQLDLSITVTASEQADYFKVVLAAARHIEELRDIAQKTKHLTHGMMRFAEGKMSSRKGNVVTGEALLQELTEVARERAKESRAEDSDKLAQEIAVAAVKYQVLRQATGKDIIFNREQALSVEGDSGPYLQYAHARTCAILEKASEAEVTPQISVGAANSDLNRLVARFPDVVERALQELAPHLVTTYLTQLAARFNRWYAEEQILDGTPAAAHKVALTDAVRATLKNGLWILGIPAPERM